MNYSEIKAQALASYPPTSIVIRTVANDIGPGHIIADRLCMGKQGARTVRRWLGGELPIPKAYWVLMCLERELSCEVSGEEK